MYKDKKEEREERRREEKKKRKERGDKEEGGGRERRERICGVPAYFQAGYKFFKTQVIQDVHKHICKRGMQGVRGHEAENAW